MSEIKNVILKDLAEKIDADSISELKCGKFSKVIFIVLLKIDTDYFKIEDWNDACNYFMKSNMIFKTSREARYSLMSFLYKERWKLIIDC